MRIIRYCGIATLLLSFAVPGWAQEAADVSAYRPIYDPATPPTKKIELAEAFLAESGKEFQESQYRVPVYMNLYVAYRNEKIWAKALSTIDRAETLVPKLSPEDRMKLYLEGMGIAANETKDIRKSAAYAERILGLDPKNLSALLTLMVTANQAKDVKKALDYAERIVAIDPNEINALLTLATVIPALPAEVAAQGPILAKTVGHGRKLLSVDKPATIPDDQWQEVRKTVQIQVQNLEAVIVFNKQDWVACANAYEELVKLTPRDSATWFRLGACYFGQAIAANKVSAATSAKLEAFMKECGEAAQAARDAEIAFVMACNENSSCTTEENTAKRAELQAKFDSVNCESEANKAKSADFESAAAKDKKDFEPKRDKAINAYASSIATSTGAEIPTARTQLENLYKTKPDATLTIDALIAQRKKDLGL